MRLSYTILHKGKDISTPAFKIAPLWSMAVAESPMPASPAMLSPSGSEDDAMRASLELAWQLQKEEEERLRQQA